jgi:GNAT superfamily N-acetyltransferase
LLPCTGQWRWEGFFKARGIAVADVLRHEHAGAQAQQRLPCTFVLLKANEPLGMVTLAENDLNIRPALNPWLADLYVAEPFRGRGHGLRLVRGLEMHAQDMGISRLWLFTSGAMGLYAKAGWAPVEEVQREGTTMTIMSRAL